MKNCPNCDEELDKEMIIAGTCDHCGEPLEDDDLESDDEDEDDEDEEEDDEEDEEESDEDGDKDGPPKKKKGPR